MQRHDSLHFLSSSSLLLRLTHVIQLHQPIFGSDFNPFVALLILPLSSPLVVPVFVLVYVVLVKKKLRKPWTYVGFERNCLWKSCESHSAACTDEELTFFPQFPLSFIFFFVSCQLISVSSCRQFCTSCFPVNSLVKISEQRCNLSINNRSVVVDVRIVYEQLMQKINHNEVMKPLQSKLSKYYTCMNVNVTLYINA